MTSVADLEGSGTRTPYIVRYIYNKIFYFFHVEESDKKDVSILLFHPHPHSLPHPPQMEFHDPPLEIALSICRHLYYSERDVVPW